MGSLLVLVVLLGMWGFVLVPLVRSQQQRSNELRSVTRFSSALRVLSRHTAYAGRGGAGMRQWVMRPGEGLDAARQRRLSAESPSSRAATRRRHLLTGLAGLVLLSLLMVAVGGAKFLVVQVLADLALLGGLAACRWSVQQERAAARRAARRRARIRREAIEARETLRYQPERQADLLPGLDRRVLELTRPARVPAAPEAAELSGVPLTTVPLDAPLMPRRAVPTVPTVLDRPAASAAAAMTTMPPSVDSSGYAGVGIIPAGVEAAARHQQQRAADVPAPRRNAPPAWSASARPATPAVRDRMPVEPLDLPEIDLEWDPAIPEPASGVRLVNLSGRPETSRTPLFDDLADPSEGTDIGDDTRLEGLIARRAAASGW